MHLRLHSAVEPFVESERCVRNGSNELVSNE